MDFEGSHHMKGGMQGMLQQMQKMQQEIQRAQEELKDKTVTEEAGGGMIRATANGGKEIVAIEIDPEAIDPDDKEILEDLVVAAVNKALGSAAKMAEDEMQNLTKGFLPPGTNIPGMV